MHISDAGASIHHDRYVSAHFGWVKLVVADTRFVNDAARFIAEGVTPIVRTWRREFGASPYDRDLRSITVAYLNAGVKWFEFYNEPNQSVEWPPGVQVDWRNTDGVIRPLMDNWMVWAEYIASLGAYPGFIPLSETGYDPLASSRWMDAFLNYLAQNYRDRFRSLLNSGLFAATHPYILNHFYQEVPGFPGTPRPPEQQYAGEGGWHFEYPYDAISQASEPGVSVTSGPPWKPSGDPVGLAAMGQLFNERAATLFGANAVPVVGTEGGIWPFPYPGSAPSQPDPRYPPVTFDSHAEATLAMFEWIAQQAPPWFFGVCLWKEDEYYDRIHAKAIDRLEQTAPILKPVPPTATVGTLGAGAHPPGPGPVHGEPDFHMVLLAPGLEPRWFFETAQPYWDRFRPIVTTSTDFIGFFTYDKSLAATIIAPPAALDAMKTAILEKYPNVLIDPIVAVGSDLSSVINVFTKRVYLNQRFG
jgi:hypothetical protein